MLVTGPSIADPTGNAASGISPGIPQRLLQSERETLLGRIHGEDDDFDGFARLHHVAGLAYAFGPRHLGDVDQAFNAGLEFDEEAEIGQPSDGAANALAGFVFVGDRVPGMRLQLLQAERNALLFGINLQDLGFDLLPGRENVGRLVDAAPGNVGDMQQAVDAADVNEGAVVGRDCGPCP